MSSEKIIFKTGGHFSSNSELERWFLFSRPSIEMGYRHRIIDDYRNYENWQWISSLVPLAGRNE